MKFSFLLRFNLRVERHLALRIGNQINRSYCRPAFPQWDGIDRTANITIDTENEFNQISAPVQDPSLGTIIPHLKFKRAM